MKKTSTTALLILLFLNVSAQQLRIGLEAGPAFGIHKVRSADGPWVGYWQSKNLHFRAGVPLELSFPSHLRISSGLFYNTKGTRNMYLAYLPGDGGNLLYGALELLMCIGYESHAKDGQQFSIGAGPYIGLGLHGAKMSSGTDPNLHYRLTKARMRWGNDAGYDMQALQWGFQAQAGYQFHSGISLKLILQSGTNAAPRENKNTRNDIIEVRNKFYTAFTVGYLLPARSREVKEDITAVAPVPGGARAKRIHIGVEAGAAFGWHSVESEQGLTKASYNTLATRFRGGVPLEWSLSQALKVSSGIFYTVKGDKGFPRTYLPPVGGMLDYSVLEMPVQMSYQKKSRKNNSFFAGLGPYIGVGIKGTLRKRDISTETRSSEAVQWGNDQGDHIRRMQYGLQAQTGWIHRSGFLWRLVVQTGNDAAPKGNKKANLGITGVSNMIYAGLTAGYLISYHQHNK